MWGSLLNKQTVLLRFISNLWFHVTPSDVFLQVFFWRLMGNKLIILNTKMTRLPMPKSWERRNGDHKEFSNFMPEVYGSSWQYVLSHLYDYPYRNSQDFCHLLQWQKRLLSGMQEKLVLSFVVSAKETPFFHVTAQRCVCFPLKS